MSTVTDVRYALHYALSTHSLLFKVSSETFMDRGADVSFLSTFPSEAEVLYPPLTYLRPTGKTESIEVGGRQVRIVEVVPHMSST